MNIVALMELQILAEHITYLRNKNVNNGNDDLIKIAKDSYKNIAEQIGLIYIPKKESE